MKRNVLVLAVLPAVVLSACSSGAGPDGRAPTRVQPPSATERAVIERAEAGYTAWVGEQADRLLARTRQFAAAVSEGDDARARDLYPRARTHWERIETVAESFGDLDPRLDAREADLAAGERWTGWHRLEKDLWPERAVGYAPLTTRQRERLAALLVRDTRTLVGRIQRLHLHAAEIVSGSRGLLEEVATGKITGEEEYWSGTDLYDVQANVDGARLGYDQLRPLVRGRDAALARTLDKRFAALQRVLDGLRRGDGFVLYGSLSQPRLRNLAAAVNAVAEPLSALGAVVPA